MNFQLDAKVEKRPLTIHKCVNVQRVFAKMESTLGQCL